jgi:hypothetical protein
VANLVITTGGPLELRTEVAKAFSLCVSKERASARSFGLDLPCPLAQD